MSSDVGSHALEISTGQDEHPVENKSKQIPNLLENHIDTLNFLKP